MHFLKYLQFFIIAVISVQYLTIKTFSQTYSGNIVFASQSEVNNFENYELITGDLIISGVDINDLSNLNSIKMISGSLIIKNNYILNNLVGLDSLIKIGGDLTIVKNKLLQNLTGLTSLVSIGGRFRLSINNKLNNVDGLQNLKRIGSELRIAFNPKLDHLNGLKGLLNVKIISIVSNTMLKNLIGFENIDSTIESLYIIGNYNIISFKGLERLKKISSMLWIWNNIKLESFDGLENVQSIGGEFILYDNKSLKNFNGLNSLKVINNLRVYNHNILENFSGLENLEMVCFDLDIRNNTSLENFIGLSKLNSISELYIINNSSLKNCVGFEKINQLRTLNLTDNYSLINLFGFNNLKTISNLLEIKNNGIKNLRGLESLNFVDSITIENNQSLESLAGLSLLSDVRYLGILSNPKLVKFCSLYNLFMSDNNLSYNFYSNGINPDKQDIILEKGCRYSINYIVVFPDCNDSTKSYILQEGRRGEGVAFNFLPLKLPVEYSDYQENFDILVNSSITIPRYSLSENINLKIIFSRSCDEDFFDNPLTDSLTELVSFNIEISNKFNGVYDPAAYFYLNGDNEAILSIPKYRFRSIGNLLGIGIQNFMVYYTTNDNIPDFGGVRKTETFNNYDFHLRHFSEINIGYLNNIVSVEGVELTDLPSEYNLSQNYPNPFNPTTTINYEIPKVETHGHASLQIRVFDVLGREVKTLVNEPKSAGRYSVTFDASDLTSGVYYYQLQSGSYVETKKMVLMK